MHAPTFLGRTLLLAATSLGATSALADITLYEHAQFGGAHVTLRGSTADISGTGFNDKTSSIVVRSGRWEVCTNSNFRGTCTVLTRGEYPVLQANMHDRISSAREAGDRRGNRRDRDRRDERAGDGVLQSEVAPPGRDRVGGLPDSYTNQNYGSDRPRDGDGRRDAPGRGGIGLELYADSDFGGESVRIERDTADLSRANFNDRATSVVVTGGTWEICSDARYGGSCATYRPGQYARLGDLSRQASSVRRVR